MIFLVVLLLVATGVLRVIANSPVWKGKRGEEIVAARLKRQLPESYLMINDVYLPLEDGTTTQIDHIIVSKFGIFVVETKNYSGWIFAAESSQKWTQTIYHCKHSFQNPIRQNFRHICALSERLNIPRDYFISVVAFTGDCDFKTDRPKGVVYSRGAADYIQSFTKPLIKDIQVPEILDAIEAWQGTVTESMRKSHVANLARRRKVLPKVDTSEPACPRCGAHMVLRHRKSDGGAFYGCSNFPRCYGIVNIDGRCA